MTDQYSARQIFDSAEFLDISNDFRSTEPYATQVIGSTATAVVAGTASYESRKWWVVETLEKVVGIAMHTAPFNIFLSPMPSEAVLVLAELVAEEEFDIPGINGPHELVNIFADRLVELSPTPIKFELHQELLAYALQKLKMPDRVVGSARVAQEKDFDLILRWSHAFAEEAGVESHDLDLTVHRVIDGKRLYLWIVDGAIVSMAGFSKAIPFPDGTLCRVGPVYTPPEFRKRGYASFVTAQICQFLIDEGHAVMLYADSKNQDSNGIYIKIGFKLVGQSSVWLVKRD